MAPVLCDRDQWVASGGDPTPLELIARVGLVAPFSDGASRCVAMVHPARPHVGAIADWVGPPAVLRAAEAWLLEQGCTEAQGPMWGCSWFPYRATLGPRDAPPMWLEPQEPGSRWEAAGYEPTARYVSILAKHADQIRAGMDRAGALSSRGWTVTSVASLVGDTVPTTQQFDAAVATVHALCERAFADVEGTVPVSADVVADWYRAQGMGLDLGLTLLARTPDGELAGFLLGIPADPPGADNDRSWFQILTLAVVPKHRHGGIATWLVAAAHQAARRAGYTAGVHSMVRVEGETLEDTTWFRGDVIRRYALYRRSLEAE